VAAGRYFTSATLDHLRFAGNTFLSATLWRFHQKSNAEIVTFVATFRRTATSSGPPATSLLAGHLPAMKWRDDDGVIERAGVSRRGVSVPK
jgi:hypothetical protein